MRRWNEAQALLAAHQALLAETREADVARHRELVALRRSLRAVIGMQHRDYRMLRTARSSVASEDAEETANEVGETATLTRSSPFDPSAPEHAPGARSDNGGTSFVGETGIVYEAA